MLRVTQQSQQNTAIGAIRRNYSEMEISQRRLSTGQRIQFPHQNVTGAVNSIYYRTRLSSIEQFENNIVDAKERLNIVYDSLSSLNQALNRAREIAVQGANGTYSKEDRVIMAMEVEEMLERAYDISLSKSKGEYIFSGTAVNTAPFRAHYKQNEEMGREVMSAISYEGDDNSQNREIENGRYINVGTPGNHSFWATNSELISTTDSANYIATSNQKIMIDNNIIEIKQGDNIETIVQRINDSGGNVKASIGALRGVQKVIQLETREPHKIILQDLEGGTVFQDIGLIREGLGNHPANNYEPSVVTNGKSVFETLMYLRDTLLNDEGAKIGGDALGFIDCAIDNVVTNQARASAKVERLDMGYRNFEDQKFATREALGKNEDIDYTSEIVNFNMWQYAHNASLQTTGKLLGRTLMDYLR